MSEHVGMVLIKLEEGHSSAARSFEDVQAVDE